MTAPLATTDRDDYVAGMHVEVRVLAALRDMARAQFAAAQPGASGDLAALVVERQAVEDELQALERTLLPCRAALSPEVRASADIDRLHTEARTIVAEILATDRDTLALLSAAADARPARVRELDTGEATLAAYRRAVTQPTLSKELIDRVG